MSHQHKVCLFFSERVDSSYPRHSHPQSARSFRHSRTQAYRVQQLLVSSLSHIHPPICLDRWTDLKTPTLHGSSGSLVFEATSSFVKWTKSILDRFNLAGLNTEVKYYHHAFELVTDSLEEELDTATWDEVEKSARHLYGLVHARFITTSRGLSKMFEKFKATEFGRCPRVLCHNQAVLPIGLV
ncbi:hypothetical protein BASA60_002504 [Batrachochytrium salamandrivorans]|nr:hypothetical protein BASA60_002504 [Batrachochytrium salamandrivorans]